ncbi:MAG TPA: hypothetical protein VHE83_02430 [Mycobacteriales bacterium]|nr:hypothetical protein [Mycobacteriales bacterium]
MAEETTTGHLRRVRVVVVGGGSRQWVPTLACDLATAPSLRSMDLVLHDIEPARCEVTVRYCELVAAARGLDWGVAVEADRRTALRDADYVLVSVTAGGRAALHGDIAINARYGIRSPKADTASPAGIARGVRAARVLHAIARDVREVAPGAWLINVTNPMAMSCRAALLAHDRVVGLCDALPGTELWLGAVLRADPARIRMEVAGTNHLPLVVGGTAGDEPLFEALERALADEAWMSTVLGRMPDPDVDGSLVVPGGLGRSPLAGRDLCVRDLLDDWQVSLHLWRTTGVLGGAGDEHTAELLPGYDCSQWNVHVRTGADYDAGELRFTRELERRLAEEDVPSWRSAERVVTFIEGHLGGPTQRIPVNVANGAQQALGVDADAVVESYATVTPAGIALEAPVALPEEMVARTQRAADSQDAAVRFALHDEPDALHDALVADPTTDLLRPTELGALHRDLLTHLAR